MEKQYYLKDVVVEDDNSHIYNLILVSWLHVNSMSFPIIYCVVFDIVQNVIVNVGGFFKLYDCDKQIGQY